MKRSYDLVAGVYDKLAGIVIGDDLRKAQVYFLKKIPLNANILIVGGGTGWILEEIANIYPEHLCIDYVDISGKMIAKAKQRFTGNNTVNFIHQSITDFTNTVLYDTIITPFFLDNFSDTTTQQVFALLHQKLQPGGLWLYADFQLTNKHSYWQKTLLFMMYSFFRIACNIEARRLPDAFSCFNKHGYVLIESKTFSAGFIITSFYVK